MPSCKVCIHPDRATIDKEIVTGRSLRDIAGQRGFSRSSVDRHKSHIPKALTKAKHAETVAESNSLLSRVERLMTRCETIYDRSMDAGEMSGAAAAAREMRGCLELLGKLNGELQTTGRVQINFATIQNLDVASLTQEQVGALYDRVQAERIREIKQLSDAELDQQIENLLMEMGRVPKTLCTTPPQIIDGTRV